MADNTFGNRLGGRLNYESQSVYKPSFGTFASGELSQSHQRLQTQMEAEYSAMQSAGQDSQSQLNRAIEQMKQDVQGQGEETTLAESPWKGPLDPEGEVY